LNRRLEIFDLDTTAGAPTDGSKYLRLRLGELAVWITSIPTNSLRERAISRALGGQISDRPRDVSRIAPLSQPYRVDVLIYIYGAVWRCEPEPIGEEPGRETYVIPCSTRMRRIPNVMNLGSIRIIRQ
jgi:hypothetical protein